MTSSSKHLDYKIVLLGSQGVGKTSIIVRYVSNTFYTHASPTIGASFFTCKLNLNDYDIRLQVWDTAGQERFRSMAPLYYRNATVALIVFDLTNRQTFDDVHIWVEEVKKNSSNPIEFVVIGNKLDLDDQRQVTEKEATEYAIRIGAKYFSVSALSNNGIENVFREIGYGLLSMYCTLSNHGDTNENKKDALKLDSIKKDDYKLQCCN